MWQRLTTAMGRPELANDPRYAKTKSRDDHRAEVNALVSAWAKSIDTADLLLACEQAEAPAAKLLSISDIFKDPQYAARGNLQSINDPRLGELIIPAPLPRMSRTPAELRTAGPALGDANTEIYGGLLGLDEEQLNSLRQRKII
jgi:crotonobetainyl-CoA:carnitine CoA-transferase CaiB-like acyl-CoA transferase